MKFFFSLFLFAFATATHAEAPGATLVFPQSAQHAHLKWVTPPAANQEAVLEVQWMNNSPHEPAEPNGSLGVSLWMPAMGHGSAPVVIQHAAGAEPGSLRISRLFFLMDGAWEVRFALTHGNGSVETQVWPVMVGSAQ